MERELCPAATGALFIGDNGLGLHNGLNECPFFNEGVNCLSNYWLGNCPSVTAV